MGRSISYFIAFTLAFCIVMYLLDLSLMKAQGLPLTP